MRRAAAVAVAAGVVAAVLTVLAVGWGGPDAVEREQRTQPPVPTPSLPVPAPQQAFEHTPPPAEPPVPRRHGLPTREVLDRAVGPRPPVDPEAVHDPASGGVRAALFTRHPRLLDCHADHADRFGGLDGRWTMEVTVSPGDDGFGEVSVRTLNDGEAVDDLDACVVDALHDAVFASPELPHTTRLPVPMPSG